MSTPTPSKPTLWEDWIDRTLINDIQNPEKSDPVPLFETHGVENPETSDALDTYRYGKNDGDFLYLLYLLDGPADDPHSVIPVYVGESRNISDRLRKHASKIRDALPITEWTDDGSWGSWGKYDHMAAVYEQSETPLYAWICDVDAIETGPYGYPTYRHELEAKLVGLIRAQPRFDATFTNREFVPNRTLHEMGKRGPTWVTDPRNRPTPDSTPGTYSPPATKADCWQSWSEEYLLADLHDEETADPIPLFDTIDDLQVRLTDSGRLKRSEAIDTRIREEGQKCVHADGVRDNSNEGLLYVMYQLAADADPESLEAADIIPRYIGKGEAYGKKNELSANFTEIAKDRDGTRQFARWGDGDYWHVGELSMALFEGDSRKRLWATELFEPGSRRLTDQTYLWVRAWNADRDIGPYGYPAYLAEVEPLLIGAAYDASPERLLNKDGVPDDAPANTRTPTFETLPDPTESDGSEQQRLGDIE